MTVIISISKTTATIDAATIQAVLTWVKTNIRDKLPAETTMTETYTVTP